MADVTKKYPTNVKGKVYVDNTCIDCDLCRAEVPEVFARHDDGYSYVAHQPESDEVMERTVEVIGNCPVEAIGDNGEDSEDSNEQSA